MATLVTYLLNEIWYKQVASALGTRRCLLHRLKTTWTLVHKRLQIWLPFLPTQRKFCILLHAGLRKCSK